MHPYLAIATGLKKRGHDAVVATSEVYREKVQNEGVGFAPVRPNVGELMGNQEFVEKLWDPIRGTENLVRDYLLPAVQDSYDDLLAAATGADLLLTHVAAYAGPIVAEKLKLRWLSVALQPLVFLSVYDRPTLAPIPLINELGVLGPIYYRALFAMAGARAGQFTGPILRVRERAGLDKPIGNPLFRGWFSPYGTLALFSRHFANPQRDWPAHVSVCGFPFFDRLGTEHGLSPELKAFLDNGPPPVLFTLGSSAVMHPGSFFRESLEVAIQMNVRAVLLTGALAGDDVIPTPLPANIHAAGYAPYSEIMPRCSAIVHQAGIGTTAQALRSGRPMIAVPWSHDQPDNAERLRRLGVSRTVRRSSYRARKVVENLTELLADTRYAQTAAKIAAAIQGEHAVETACDAIEAALVNG